MEVKSNAVKSNIAQEPGMLGPGNRQIGSGQTGDGKSDIISGISKLKWNGTGEFNSDGHYIYYCGQESLRRNGVAIMVNKRVRNAVLGCSLKNDRLISVVSKANHSISR